MARPEPRSSPCDAATRVGRLAKAQEFVSAAHNLRDLRDHDEQFADAIIRLYVHTGVAAADVICCSRLGKHARGEGHDEAVRLLTRVDNAAAKSLSVLLGMKTRAGYSSQAASKSDLVRAERAAEALLRAALEA